MSGQALLFVTDLDGCLLDDETYSHAAAREALEALAAARVPLVLCSSKTRAEMEPLARELRLEAPLVVENGGALVIPAAHLAREPRGARREGDAWLVGLGAPRAALSAALGVIADETGAKLRAFSALGLEEVRRLTGLSETGARRALAREYDEPFLLEDPGLAPVVREAAERRGLRVTRGGRFHHLMGRTDKGRALRVLLGLYEAEGRRFFTVGLGDSDNDLTMLQAVDRPILVPRPGGEIAPALAAGLPQAERAPRPGPVGWNAAVLAVLSGARLPSVTSTPAARSEA